MFRGQSSVFNQTSNHLFILLGANQQVAAGAETNLLCFQDSLMILLLLASFGSHGLSTVNSVWYAKDGTVFCLVTSTTHSGRALGLQRNGYMSLREIERGKFHGMPLTPYTSSGSHCLPSQRNILKPLGLVVLFLVAVTCTCLVAKTL